MADTTFVNNQTVTDAEWFNDVNDHVYSTATTNPDSWSFSVAMASNAITITLLAIDGSALSASAPARVTFRHATATNGTQSQASITSAVTLTVSSGSTLGTTDAVPHRIWVVLFNDGGTYRLGVVNCTLSDGWRSLQDDILEDSTAEGGAGGADTAGVIYTGTAVTDKPMRILGYFESTQTTAGTWATAASKLQAWEKGMKLPGDVLQVRRTQTGAVATGTTVAVHDDSIPQNTEGDQYMSQAITPTSAINRLMIESLAYTAHSAAGGITIIALFQDSTADALAAGNSAQRQSTANTRAAAFLKHYMRAGTVSSTTFNIRIGDNAAGTTTFNGQGGGRILGGASASYLEIREIMV